MSTQHKRSILPKAYTASSMRKNLRVAVDNPRHLRQTDRI